MSLKDNTFLIMHIVGARPNFMKIAPLIRAIEKHNQISHLKLRQILVHTGQHYDEKMSALFFDHLGLPRPDIDLGVGSASHAVQTAEIMKRFEKVLLEHRPDAIIVVGDVNSTIACALVAAKIEYTDHYRRRPLIVHVEAGLRSFDRTMPEEINRLLTDQISDLLFITEESAKENLLREGIAEDKIFFVGNVMIDTLLQHLEKAKQSDILERLGLKEKRYALLTLHRPSNVDYKETFLQILEALKEISQTIPIIFPIHPRTQQRVKSFGLERFFSGFLGGHNDSQIRTIEPLGYLDFLKLMSLARLVLTDSGGIQEETTVLGVPCITIRENTERPVTIKEGSNTLVGTNKEKIIAAAQAVLNGAFAKRKIPPLWDGRAAERIVPILAQKLLEDQPR